MNKATAFIDPELFGHATQLFEEKRRVLAPAIVEGFARQVVTRLASTVTVRRPVSPVPISAEDLSAFCDLLLQPDQNRRALGFVASRRNEGASIEDIYLGYIGPAARLLGERWETDALTSLQVTIGAGTLYALMRALRNVSTANPSQDAGRAALFASVPGEKHGIGVTVAADMFREAGWQIDLQLGRDQAQLVEHAARTTPGVIGLSLSTAERLPELVQIVLGLRLVVPNAVIGVAHGGELRAADIQRIADVDLIFDDASSAIHMLERRMHERRAMDPAG
jgi:methanogenic corrinoid protein MtbC1